MDRFEYAVRNKLRFSSARGDLTVEQLWDVPLRSKDGFNLDIIARTAKKALGEASEESFVDEKPKNTRLEVAFDIVKYVIDVRLDEEEKAKTRAAARLEREKLLRILAEKQEGKLSDLSEKELKKRIDELAD
jgi:hypothetical protein